MPNPSDPSAEPRSPENQEGFTSGDRQDGGPRAVPVGNVGDALRSVYQHTVQEDVPDEMLDLLGRLS